MRQHGFKEVFTSTRLGQLHHLELGEGNPLILLHSTGFSAWQWQDALPKLAQGRRVLAVDLLGHGDSDSYSGNRSIRQHAEVIVEWASVLGLRQPAVCGNSLGGVICLALASDFAEHIGMAILTETPVRDDERWSVQWASSERFFTMGAQPFDMMLARFANPTAQLHERWNTDRAKSGAHVMMDAIWAIRQFDAIAALDHLRAPAFAIMGGNGPLKDVWPRLIAKFGEENVIRLPGCAHFPMIDDPDAFAAAVHARLPGR